jgi:SAM-dependent methyltransferase
MLGHSSSLFNKLISQLIGWVDPSSILELGCGQGKLATLIQDRSQELNLTAIQKIFKFDDLNELKKIGYTKIIDMDIYDYFREGFDENYDLIVGLDVIEHFLYSDIISIINFALYRADFMLLVWPSAHPQSAVNNSFDRHRASFDLKDLTNHFDVVFYTQSGFAQINFLHKYHIVLLRGHMNIKVMTSFVVD